MHAYTYICQFDLINSPPPPHTHQQIRLIDTQYSNSAYHGAALDQDHIASELERFLQALERKYGITRQAIASEGACLRVLCLDDSCRSL